jgi:hypothetical protein
MFIVSILYNELVELNVKTFFHVATIPRSILYTHVYIICIKRYLYLYNSYL